MNILLGVSGSVAAYKSAELLRLLLEEQHQVKVILTEGGQRFVQPLLFRSLGASGVYQNLWEADNGMAHITLTRWADIMVIAPASANVLARMAQGLATDLLTNCTLASQVPIVVAPAMNQAMYAHPAVQRNLETLCNDGVVVFPTAEGKQACGEVGEGRMLEPMELLKRIAKIKQ